MSKEQEYLCKTKSQHFFDAIGWSFTWGLKIAGIIFISIVTWRIANVNVDISYFKDYNFNDLLSLILALFAILISILFYFKSTESSNKFYSDTYRFTKDISESIGRIDERFGEKMTSLYDNFNRLDSYLHSQHGKVKNEIKNVEESEQKAAESKEKSEQEYQKIINDLFEKTKIVGKEREALLHRLQQIQQERDEAIEKLSLAQHKLRNLQMIEHERHQVFLNGNIQQKKVYSRISQLLKEEPRLKQFIPQGWSITNEFFCTIKNDLPRALSEELKLWGLIDSDNNLTRFGYRMLANYIL